MRPSLIATGAAMGWTLPALSAHAPMLAAALAIERRLPASAEGGEVALSFDDGPHPLGTPAILAALERRGARATFFMVGEQVRRRPGLAREVLAAGHGIGLHGDRHRNALALTPSALGDDVDRGTTAIAEATGLTPLTYRPPYGIFTAPGLVLARRRGLRTVLWSRWGRDWTRGATPASIADTAAREIESGDIVLLHDADFYGAAGSWSHTVKALPQVLDAIERAGLTTAVI